MKKIPTLALVALFGLVSASASFAQTPAPAKPAAPAAAAPAAPAAAPAAAPMKMGAAEKAAMSKKCSADADAKGLHGKERKKFREACKEGKM